MDASKTILGMLIGPDGSGPEAAVMTLSSMTLFPQELQALYIFEAKYRRMLADVLASHRMFVVATRKNVSGSGPASEGCLGLVRVCVQNPDGTSHLILQGIARVELTDAVRTRPYRVHKLRAVDAPLRKSKSKSNKL